jgi:hypothetical protein
LSEFIAGREKVADWIVSFFLIHLGDVLVGAGFTLWDI